MPEQLTVMSIREHYEAERTKLLTETFDLGTKAGQVELKMSNTTKEALGPRGVRAAHAAEAAEVAEAERQRLKTKYVELETEMLAAVEVRIAEIEQELAPNNASFADFAAAAAASEEALKAAMDMALASGDEDAALVAFSAARERDLDAVVSHAITIREDWEDLMAEMNLAAS